MKKEKKDKKKKVKKKPKTLKKEKIKPEEKKVKKPVKEEVEEPKMEIVPEFNIEEIKEEIPEKKVVKVEKPKIVIKPKKIKKIKKKKVKKKPKTLKKEKIKPKKKIGGGSFIASGILSIMVPAIFYIVLGDFTAFMGSCGLPFSSVDIGNEMIVNCTELRLVFVLSFLFVFIGLILVVWGLAKKIIKMRESSKNV